MISSAALEEFKVLWHEEFGSEISDGQATELATNLLTAFSHSYRSVRKEWLKGPPDEIERAIVLEIKNVIKNENEEKNKNS
jgi:hypothetical protein